MTKRETRVINAFINCVKSGEFTEDYAITLIEDNQRYGWLTDTAKDEFYAALDALTPEPEPETPGARIDSAPVTTGGAAEEPAEEEPADESPGEEAETETADPAEENEEPQEEAPEIEQTEPEGDDGE